ncbi:MAG: hypothetical protein WCX22_10435 [Methanoregula sp.]
MHKALRVLRENCAYPLANIRRSEPALMHRMKKTIITRANCKQSEIRTINFSDPADKARHDRMVALVTQMLGLNKKLQDASLDHEKELLARQVEATDASIDKLVYELYGLTEEEIGIVESGAGK